MAAKRAGLLSGIWRLLCRRTHGGRVFVTGSMLSSALAMALCAGCAHLPPAAQAVAARSAAVAVPTASFQQAGGPFYTVQNGDTLWGIAQTFGVTPASLVSANHLRNPRQLRIGQRLFVPVSVRSSRFLWPARGDITPRQRSITSLSSPGLEIRASVGSFVRASRTGRVAVAANKLPGVGRIVILDHGDGYLTVYSGLDALLVSPGLAVAQGAPVGRLGRAPLYFEVRYRSTSRDPLKVLP